MRRARQTKDGARVAVAGGTRGVTMPDEPEAAYLERLGQRDGLLFTVHGEGFAATKAWEAAARHRRPVVP